MNIKLTFLIIGIMMSFQIVAQRASDLISGELVIQFQSEAAFQEFSKQSPTEISFVKSVSKNLQVYLFKYDPTVLNIDRLSAQLNQNPLVRAAGQNFQAHKRTTIPNDQFFNNQESFDLIQAPEAWDINTSAPEDMVIAVIEGADINHEDLKDNIWTNPGEIEDDGIDNDNNGYIDDYFGVNIVDSSDTPIVDDHGTSVAGVIGARGDNGIGVAGMLWDVKMMIVSSNLTYVQIIESYDYVYEMRKKYNETNGEEGAKIVVTNSSFGVDNAYPDSHPLFNTWCEAYDLMGSVGILSAAAVTNNKLDIGALGDMPGTCPSDFLLTVTETNLDDELKAGFSVVHVDLSAPGRSYTTDLNNTYSIFRGTSAATPVVSGAVAMMYAYPCEGFQEQITTQPESTVLQLKEIILQSVDPIEEMNGVSVSGGRLNVFNAMQSLQEVFGAPKGSLSFTSVYPNPVQETLFVRYQTSEISDYDLKVYDSIGRLVYYEKIPKVCSKQEIEITTADFAPGIYFMSLENVNNIESTRFMVY